MVRETGPVERIYNEISEITRGNLWYKTEQRAFGNLQTIALGMHLYEPEHYLVGGDLYLEYNAGLIQKFLDFLVPESVNIMLHTKNKDEEFFDEVEPWFGTKYKGRDIPQDWLSSWSNLDVMPEFHMPPPNPYLADELIFSETEFSDEYTDYPILLGENELLEIWYKREFKFKLPTVHYSFNLVSPIMEQSVTNVAMIDLLVNFIALKYSQELYPARQTGLSVNMYSTEIGLKCCFSGYNNKQPLFLESMLKLIKQFYEDELNEQDEIMFKAVRTERAKTYHNAAKTPSNLNDMVRLSLLVKNNWNDIDKKQVVCDVTLKMMQEFAKRFFEKLRIQCLIQGNVSKEQVVSICSKFSEILDCSPFIEGIQPKYKVTKVPAGETCCRILSLNMANTTSTITNYYQSGPGGIRTSCIIDLTMMLMEAPLYNKLRTNDQLGYNVDCSARDTYDILGFSISIPYTTNRFSVQEINAKIETFLVEFLQELKQMSDEEFNLVKVSLSQRKKSEDINLAEDVSKNFEQICCQQYMFDRLVKQVEIIAEITKEELTNWFEDHISGGTQFKKLSIQVIGDTGEIEEQDVGDNQRVELKAIIGNDESINFIEDIEVFLANREFY